MGYRLKYLEYEKRIITNIVFAVVFGIIGAIFIFLSISTKTSISLQYKENSSLDYLVFLKPNEYYEQDYIGKDLQYIASLIDHIDVAFDYTYQMNERVDYKYKYYIEGEVVVFDKLNNEKPLYQKKYTLVEEQEKEINNSNIFTIQEKIIINYNEYNELVKSFTNDYNINAESILKLTLYVSSSSQHEKFSKTIDSSNSMQMIIPLTEKTIDISMDYNEINNSDTFKETTNHDPINYLFLAIGAVLLILTLVFVIKFIILISKTRTPKSEYYKTVDRILKSYDRAIVKVKKSIDIPSDATLIDVESFEQLLDAGDRLELPILYMEIHKGQKCWFIVRNNDEIYRMVLKSVDLEK